MPVIILHLFQALDGFLLVVTQGGTILFASESVTSLLNHLPVSLNDALRKKTVAVEANKSRKFCRIIPPYQNQRVNDHFGESNSSGVN